MAKWPLRCWDVAVTETGSQGHFQLPTLEAPKRLCSWDSEILHSEAVLCLAYPFLEKKLTGFLSSLALNDSGEGGTLEVDLA